MPVNEAARLYLLPGLICNEVVWQAQVHALSDLVAVAVPDYGDARSLTTMAERVLASAPERFCLAGHSMGGRVALEIIRVAPQRVERLALFDTGVHPSNPAETKKRMDLFEIGRDKGMEALVDVWLPPMVHPDRRSDEAFMQPLRRMCIDAGLERFSNQITALLDRPDAQPLLADIRCPTLIGVGREDEWSPVPQHRDMAEAVRDAELVIFEHCGHMAPYEAPDAISETLERWLSSE